MFNLPGMNNSGETKSVQPQPQPQPQPQLEQEAQPQTSGRFPIEVSKEQQRLLPPLSYSGKIHMIRSDRAARVAIKELKRERVLGFDTETRAAFRKGEAYPPALIQLAGEKAVYLFRLTEITGLGGLEAIFSNPNIVKCGVALLRDLREIQEIVEFEPEGFVNLEEITDECGVKSNGLRGIAAAVLGGKVCKGAQRSNWARKELTEKQITYAATDAWVSREIYQRVQND